MRLPEEKLNDATDSSLKNKNKISRDSNWKEKILN